MWKPGAWIWLLQFLLFQVASCLLIHEDPRYPVTKVVTLLRDMQAQLQKEVDADEEVFNSMMCWCETNDREKSMSIQDAEARIAQLTTVEETTAADSARLTQEIKQHEQDLATSQKSLDTATGLREQQVAEFNSEEKDMLQSIKALEDAIIVLSKHHSTAAASLLDRGRLMDVLSRVKYDLDRHQTMLLGSITSRQRRLLLSFGQQPTFRQVYQPQSGEIFGILHQMKDTFQANLAETQKEETSNRKAFEELKVAKEAEIAATRDTIQNKKVHLAEADQRNAVSKQEIEDLQSALTVDDKFLLDLKERCASTKTEYDARVAMRQEELSAIAEAIKILSDDQARDIFSKVMNPATSLLQRSGGHRRGSDERGRRARAARLLGQAAAQAHWYDLLALAAVVRLDPLTKVKEAIDRLVSELKQESTLEVRKRDECISRRNENEHITESFERDRSDLQTKIEGHEGAIKEAGTSLDNLNKEIARLTLEMKRRGENREMENREFQSVVKDQKEMQVLLKKALAVLKRVYSTKDTVVVDPSRVSQLQVSASRATPPPPPQGFSTYAGNRGSGGVLAMIETIISDAKAIEVETVREEQLMQKEYEEFVKDTNVSIKAKQEQIVNLSAVKSSEQQALTSAKEDLQSKTAELETLSNTASAIRLDCDFLLRNFDTRTQARDQEIEALQEAKAVLSGME